MRLRSWPLVCASCAWLGCATGPKDSLDPTHHEVRTDAAAPDTYVHVARRPLLAIGLAEARGVTDDEAKQMVERVADLAAPCFAQFGDKLVRGAARIIVPIDPGGVVLEPKVTFSATQGSAVQGMLCIVSRVRMSAFPPSTAPTRAIALEAAWGSDLGAP
jgi:hypothetical protein